MRCTKNCHACRRHCSTERTQFFSMTMRDHMAGRTTSASKVKWVGLLSPTSYHFFKCLHEFLQGKRFHDEQEAEDAFQEFIKSQCVDFCTTEINKLISHWQKNVLTGMVPILMNKVVFEPSYTDLKVTVRNHNPFFINPILGTLDISVKSCALPTLILVWIFLTILNYYEHSLLTVLFM